MGLSYLGLEGAVPVDKKFARLIEPGFRFYFLVLFLFAAASAAFSLKIAAAEILAVVLIYFYYRRENIRRRRKIVKYVETLTYNVNDVTKTSILNFPFPMAIINAESEEISWCNDHFLRDNGKQGPDLRNKAFRRCPGV